MKARAEQKKSTETSDRDGYFSAYEEYSKVLRTWLVAYGVGGPVLLFTNERISTAVSNSPSAHWIAGPFLLGVALQVLLAVLNKNVMWTLYWGEAYPETQDGAWYQSAAWISYQFWIDMVIDAGCLALFGIASFLAFRVVLH